MVEVTPSCHTCRPQQQHPHPHTPAGNHFYAGGRARGG